MVKVGREEPAVSMDVNGEKIVWARHSEIQQVNLKAMPEGIEIKDGERLPVALKDMGSCEIYPQTIAHNPNGRLVTVRYTGCIFEQSLLYYTNCNMLWAICLCLLRKHGTTLGFIGGYGSVWTNRAEATVLCHRNGNASSKAPPLLSPVSFIPRTGSPNCPKWLAIFVICKCFFRIVPPTFTL